jgi:hypothetical protein
MCLHAAAPCCRPLLLLHTQHPANALTHRPLLLQYVVADKIKVRARLSPLLFL